VKLSSDTTDGEANSLAETFLCDRCRAGRQAIAEGKVKPMDPPAQRRNDPDGGSVMQRLHDAARRAITGR
jgi:hypothetical protein